MCMLCVSAPRLKCIAKCFGGPRKLSILVLVAFLSSVYFILWAGGALSKIHRADPLPRYRRNDPSRSVYFGNGCFWHTQVSSTRVAACACPHVCTSDFKLSDRGASLTV